MGATEEELELMLSQETLIKIELSKLYRQLGLDKANDGNLWFRIEGLEAKLREGFLPVDNFKFSLEKEKT